MTPPNPFVTSIEADFACNAKSKHRAKYMYGPSRESDVSEKRGFFSIFPPMPTRCIAAGCSKSTKDGVRLHVFPAEPRYGRLWVTKVRLTRAIVVRSDVFFSAGSEHFEPSCFESGIHHTFDMKKKVILKHDAIPAIPTTFPE